MPLFYQLNSAFFMVCHLELLHNLDLPILQESLAVKIIKIILVIALFLIALALGAQNQEVVLFNYLLAKSEFHLSTLLGLVFVVGFVIAWIVFGGMHLKARLTIRRLNQKLKKYEAGQVTTEVKSDS